MTNKLTNLSFDNAKFNNRLAYLINFLSVLIFLFCGIHYAIENWFIVDKIIIEGNLRHVTPVQLSYIAHNRLHGTFFTLNIGELKAEFEELPWVSKVSLERDFPGTVIVHLLEYNAIARIGDDHLLAEGGQIFDGADDNLNLPTFYVDPDYSVLALARYRQIQVILAAHNDSLNKLWISTPRITRFSTTKNLMVTLCDENLTGKLAMLDQNWGKLYGLNPNLTSVNFCYKNALAINTPVNNISKQTGASKKQRAKPSTLSRQ